MAQSVAHEIMRIRRILGDRQLSDAIIPGPRIEEELYDALDEVCRRVGLGVVTATGFVTVDSSGDVALPSPAGYSTVRYLRELIRESDGFPLSKTSPESIRHSRAFGGGEFGQPQEWAIERGADESATLMFHPMPQVDEVLTGVFEPTLSAVSQITGTIPMGETALLAIRRLTASRLIRGLDPDKLKRLGRSGADADSLEVQANVAIEDEAARVHEGEMLDHVVRDRRRR